MCRFVFLLCVLVAWQSLGQPKIHFDFYTDLLPFMDAALHARRGMLSDAAATALATDRGRIHTAQCPMFLIIGREVFAVTNSEAVGCTQAFLIHPIFFQRERQVDSCC